MFLSTQYLYLLKNIYIKYNIWMVAERGRPICRTHGS
jgi:hypothetical protein